MSPVRQRGGPGMQRKMGRHGDGAAGPTKAAGPPTAAGSGGVIGVTTIPREHCLMGRRDRAPALAERATYPKGSIAGDAMDAVLEFYGVDKGVIRDPAYCEPWESGAAAEDHFNASFAEPEGGMQKLRIMHDRRCLMEIIPAAGRKCFIADLQNARQCRYTRE